MWYQEIVSDLEKIPDFLEFYSKELTDAKNEARISGKLEKNMVDLPGITEHRFNQLQEIEAVLEYLNIRLRRIQRIHFQRYLENYQRTMSSRDIDKYVNGEPEVADFECIINEVALMRNQYLGIMKALETKNFMVGHLSKLKVAGMEDYRL